jgi:hypothetical protein
MGEERKAYKVLLEKPVEMRQLGRQCMDGTMGSEWVAGGRVWSGLSWLRIGTGGGLL